METDDVPLLTSPQETPETEVEKGLPAGEFQYPAYLHGVWHDDDDSQKNDSEPMFDEQIQRASSLKSNISQEPPFQSSQSLSQISEPAEERVRVSRKEAFDLLRQASSLTEAAERALAKVTGDEFLDASGDELLARDEVIEKIRKRLSNLQSETKKQKWRVKNPDQTFLSTSAVEEVIQPNKCNNFDENNEKEGERGTQTEVLSVSKGVQTAEGGLGPKLGAFRKPFDQLKVTGVYIYLNNIQSV